MSRTIVTVHGIRTYGRWQRRLEALLASDAGSDVTVYHYEYGLLTLFSFLVPFLRLLAVSRFHGELAALFEHRSSDQINIVAHSFGTYLVAEARSSELTRTRRRGSARSSSPALPSCPRPTLLNSSSMPTAARG